jgi:hypothetical protein
MYVSNRELISPISNELLKAEGQRTVNLIGNWRERQIIQKQIKIANI